VDQSNEKYTLTNSLPDVLPGSGGKSRIFFIGVLLIGILLGFILAMVLLRVPWVSQSGPVVLYDQDQVTSLFQNSSPAVIEIYLATPKGFNLPGEFEPSGSGFLVDKEGHIVTNNHVVSDYGELTVKLHDGRMISATKLGTSPADDLALVQVDPKEISGITPLKLAEDSNVKPGQMVLAIGSPFRQNNSVSVGVISGVGRTTTTRLRRPLPDLIQTDAALNPGNSGGPLLNSKGEVIGINTAVQIPSGLGFAVPTDILRGILTDLMEPGELKRPWLGISGSAITKDLQTALGLPTNRGIYVTYVCEDSPADLAKLRAETSLRSGRSADVILGVDGVIVDTMSDMVRYFNSLRPGAQITLSISRENRLIELDVILGEWTAC
jgi:2-alkenal reductase